MNTKQWVQTNYEFQSRIAILCISSRAMVLTGKLDLRSLAVDESPDTIEKVVLDIIEELRPDLSGGVLMSMAYSLYPMQWEFAYAHRSLPQVDNHIGWDGIPKQDLITGKWYLGSEPKEQVSSNGT